MLALHLALLGATAGFGARGATASHRADGPGVLAFVDTEIARRSAAVTERKLLTGADIELVLGITRRVQAACPDQQLFNNPQNAAHANSSKSCTFLNQPPEIRGGHPDDPFAALAPRVLRKLLRFADLAWREQGWSEPGGPLAAIPAPPTEPCDMFCEGGVQGLEVRIVEHWRYAAGGHLDDDFHFDGGSVLTIVVALNDGFEGGQVRTHEPDGTQLEHPLRPGDGASLFSQRAPASAPLTTVPTAQGCASCRTSTTISSRCGAASARASSSSSGTRAPRCCSACLIVSRHTAVVR